MNKDRELSAWIFCGVVSYGYAITCAATWEEAAKNLGLPPQRCTEWPAEWPRANRRKCPYEYRRIKEGDTAEVGE